MCTLPSHTSCTHLSMLVIRVAPELDSVAIPALQWCWNMWRVVRKQPMPTRKRPWTPWRASAALLLAVFLLLSLSEAANKTTYPARNGTSEASRSPGATQANSSTAAKGQVVEDREFIVIWKHTAPGKRLTSEVCGDEAVQALVLQAAALNSTSGPGNPRETPASSGANTKSGIDVNCTAVFTSLMSGFSGQTLGMHARFAEAWATAVQPRSTVPSPPTCAAGIFGEGAVEELRVVYKGQIDQIERSNTFKVGMELWTTMSCLRLIIKACH